MCVRRHSRPVLGARIPGVSPRDPVCRWRRDRRGKPATAMSGAQCVRGGAVVRARRRRSLPGGESYLRGGLVTGQLLAAGRVESLRQFAFDSVQDLVSRPRNSRHNSAVVRVEALAQTFDGAIDVVLVKNLIRSCVERMRGIPSINRHLELGGLSAEARRRPQHEVELSRAGEHPARAGLSCELRVDAVSDRWWYQHDHHGLSLERHGAGVGVLGGEGREYGAVAGGRGAATGTAALSDGKTGGAAAISSARAPSAQ